MNNGVNNEGVNNGFNPQEPNPSITPVVNNNPSVASTVSNTVSQPISQSNSVTPREEIKAAKVYKLIKIIQKINQCKTVLLNKCKHLNQ